MFHRRLLRLPGSGLGWLNACALLLAVALFSGNVVAQNLVPIPALTGRVIDTTRTLSAADAQALEAKLAAFEQTKGTQIVVLMVATTQPEDIVSFANRVGNVWKIGRRDVGDGVLLIVAKDDRKVRIEVAKTLEGAIPDLAARQVIESAITPNFKQGNYAAGLSAAADQLIARVRKTAHDGRHLLAGTSYGGGAVPLENVVRASDFLLLHGNGVSDPQRITEMVNQTRAVAGYRPMPIVFNEDDHERFDEPANNFTAALAAHASWGWFDYRRKGEGVEEGYQSPPVSWGIGSARKRAFFEFLAKVAGR